MRTAAGMTTMTDHPDAAEWPVSALHARGEGIMLGESWVLTSGSLPYREAGERILSALDVPRPEWPRQPSRTAEDAQERTGGGEGESPAPGSPGPVAAITAALEGNWRERVTVALDASVDRCARCKVCDNQVDAVMAAILPLAELENAITWDTSCTSCARVLDSAYEQTCRAEAAEGKLAAIERQCGKAAGVLRRGTGVPFSRQDVMVDARYILEIISTGGDEGDG